MNIHGILFDFDGTLTRPEGIDFGLLREVTGCPAGQPILEFIAALEDLAEQEDAHLRLHQAELQAARRSMPNDGAEELLHWCRQRHLRVGILTRNTHEAVETALRNFTMCSVADFAGIVSRDDPVAPKPSPEGVHLAANRMELEPRQMMMVGDFWFDIEAGAGAGSLTAYLTNGGSDGDSRCSPTFIIHQLSEVMELPVFA